MSGVAGDASQRRRLSAAARTEQGEEAALRHRETCVADSSRVAVSKGAEDSSQLADTQHDLTDSLRLTNGPALQSMIRRRQAAPPGDCVERPGDGGHESRPEDAKGGELPRLPVDPEIEHRDRHGLRRW